MKSKKNSLFGNIVCFLTKNKKTNKLKKKNFEFNKEKTSPKVA
jgi:hypothetical protein